jgi:acyl-CoA synthetase (AMP-forming)/AMP-acid ligase II
MSDERHSRHFRSSFPAVSQADFRTAAWRIGTTEKITPFFPTLISALISAAELGAETGVRLLPESDDEAPEHRSFEAIAKSARRLATVLRQRGVRADDRVLIVLPTSFDFLTTFFAVQWLGAIPVPSYPPAALERVEVGLERIAHIAAHSGAAHCITLGSLRTLMGDLARKAPSIRDLWAIDKLIDESEAAEPADAVSIAGSQTAFIQYTSGSTGKPKGVDLSHGNVIANMHAIGQALEIRRTDSVVSWLPLYHDMGLIGGLLFCFYWRIPLTLMSPTAFLMQPARWLRAIHDSQATLSVAPNFAFALAARRIRSADREGLNLSAWRLALNGAEPVNQQSVAAFEREFAPFGFRAECMFPVYGLAESCLAVTFPRPGEPKHFLRVDRAALADGNVVVREGEGTMALACVGKPMPGHEVIVADEYGDGLGYDDVGHVLVRGPSVMKGYFADPAATEAVLRDGWLWTGDLGFFRKEGLYVTGRAKDLIIVRGKNYYAEDVERVAEAVAGVRQGGAVAFAVYDEGEARDLVVVVAEITSKAEAGLAERVVAAVGEAYGLNVDEVALVEAGTLPKTSSGKRQRNLTRQRYLTDQLVPDKTGKLGIAKVFVRSATGLLQLFARRVTQRRIEPP